MDANKKYRWLIGLAALVLATGALACGPLSNLTSGLDEAQTELEALSEDMATTVVELATTMPTDEPAQPEEPPAQPADSGNIGQIGQAEPISGMPPMPAGVQPGPGVGQTPAGASGTAMTQWAIFAQASTEYGSDGWSAMQVTGEVNTFECGDITTAFATANSTGKDWLRVGYASAVIPTEIIVHQTYNPGSVIRIDVIDAGGNLATVYDGISGDPGQCPVSVPYIIEGVDFPVAEVVIYLDQSIIGSWNEIDAVELVGVAP